jgi:uncharacterized membrane protein
MQLTIFRAHGRDSALARALGRDLKGKITALLYVTGILLAFVRTWMADAVYVLVALMWLVPDRRVEHAVAGRNIKRST